MIKIGQVRQALLGTGFTESTQILPGEQVLRSTGFTVSDHDGRIQVTYEPGQWASSWSAWERRSMIGAQLDSMERALSQQGFTAVLFVPDSGFQHFRLTVTSRRA